VHLTHLFNHFLWLGHFPAPWKEAKIITLPKPSKNPKFTSDQPLVCYRQTVSEDDFKNNPKKKKNTEERILLNASQFSF
jgi:hypothetical protein